MIFSLMAIATASLLGAVVDATIVPDNGLNWRTAPLSLLYDNCEPLTSDFHLWWTLDASTGKLWTALESDIDHDEYMAFGISGEPYDAEMIGGDVVVADFVTGTARARDFYLKDARPCDELSKTGVCPDSSFDNGHDDVGAVFGAEYRNGAQRVTVVHYWRPVKAADPEWDRAISTIGKESVVFAIGSLDQRGYPSGHRITTNTAKFIEFGRTRAQNCAPLIAADQLGSALRASSDRASSNMVTSTHVLRATSNVMTSPPAANATVSAARGDTTMPSGHGKSVGSSAVSSPIDVKSNATGSHAVLKPFSGSSKALPGIVIPPGQKRFVTETISDRLLVVSLGPSGVPTPPVVYYVNGKPSPILRLQRGLNYTFLIMTGRDTAEPVLYQPVVIRSAANSTDPVIGPAKGRLCLWSTSLPRDAVSADFASFSRTLAIGCDPGPYDYFSWTPDRWTAAALQYDSVRTPGLGNLIQIVD